MYPRQVIQTTSFTTPFRHALLALFIALAALAPIQLLAQEPSAQNQEKPFYLHNGDTVVFYGDSITEQRYYTQWVEVYTATRFPRMQVQFFNAGIGGDSVNGGSGGTIDERLPRDVFPHKPTVVTIMLGMNDGGYEPLTKEVEGRYTQGYEHILSSIQKTLPTARLTLFGPSAYDEITRPERFPGGYNTTLTHFSELNSELAQKHGATFIDLNAPFVAALKRGVAINPLATELLVPDKVHPEPIAHWFMADAILKGWNAPSLVSSTVIDAKKGSAIDLKKANITDLSASDTGLSWREIEDALPLPLDDANMGIHFLRQLTNIDDDLNQEPLKILNLKPGNYQLTIDGTLAGTFTDVEFAKGINLAEANTPMRGQAYRVSWLIRDRDDAHYVRLRMLVNQWKNGTPAEPGASDLTKFETELQKRIYEAVQPVPHKFQIKAVESINK